ncbi:NAD(P)H-binding protein [Pseudomonas sp. SWRI107]|uniref:NAD(P)-dependent oxidoreductase n=1 Tax=Pseudomonas farsensis TaxID=2745492 RepID=UPI001648EE52|nr:NAD(P)H-binding protein [Pseudomonas farsensis]
MKNAETPALKLVLLGAESSLGNALTVQLLARQHEVIAIVDDLSRHTARPGLHYKIGGLADADQAEQSMAGGSAVIALLSALAPGDLPTQRKLCEALLAGLARTTIRRLLLVGDFQVLEGASGHSSLERECMDRIVDGLQRSGLQWTVINAPDDAPGLSIEQFRHNEAALAPDQAKRLRDLARVAAGLVDTLELGLHKGEHLNFVV